MGKTIRVYPVSDDTSVT